MSTTTITRLYVIPQPREYTRHEAEKAVLRGAVALTAHFEGSVCWVDEVDPDTLDMYSITRCVLGQVFGDWNEGLTALRINPEDAVKYGFDTPTPTPAQWLLLQTAWGSLLRALKAHR